MILSNIDHSNPPACWMPACISNIIDKKVQDFALSLLEKIVDWLLASLSSDYANLFAARSNGARDIEGIRFVDWTRTRQANMQADSLKLGETKVVDISDDFLAVISDLKFSAANTKTVRVTNIPQRGPEWLQIAAFHRDGTVRYWDVDADDFRQPSEYEVGPYPNIPNSEVVLVQALGAYTSGNISPADAPIPVKRLNAHLPIVFVAQPTPIRA